MKAVLALLLSVIIFSACHNKPATVVQTEKTAQQLDLPTWVVDPKVEGKLSAVGIAPASKGGIKVQIAQAETDARANIAAQVQVEVSRVTKDAMRKANVADTEEYEALFQQATKEVIKNLPLSGAVRNNMYKDPSDGSLYIQMVIDSSVVKVYLANHNQDFTAALAKANASRDVINKTQESFKSLFDEVDASK